MADENEQEESAPDNNQATVIDPLDAVNSTNSGDEVTPLTAYAEEVEALMNGEQTADSDDDDDLEQSDDGDQEEEEESDINDEADEEESEEDEEDEPEPKVSDRFRFKSDEDKAVAALAKARGMSLVEAARFYESMNPAKADSKAAETIAPPSMTSAEIEAEILRLEDEEIESIRLVDVDRQAEIKLELRKLNKDLNGVKNHESKAELDHAEKLNSSYQAWSAKANTAYPGLKDPNTAIFKRVQELDRMAEANGDPIFNSPDKLWVLGLQAAKDTRTLMAKTIGESNKSKSPSKTVTNHKPSSGNARTTSADTPNRASEEIESLDSLEDYERLVGIR